jgi:beta-galactosidase
VSYQDGPVAGTPAVTRHEVGDGTAWYVGTSLEPAALGRFVTDLIDEAGVRPAARVPAGVEVVRREGDGTSYLFVLNHTDDDVEVTAAGFDLRHNHPVDGSVVVRAGDAAVIREQV